MDSITWEQIAELNAEAKGPCVSLFLPTHRTGSEMQQDPVRFKNLLKRAEEELVLAGVRSSKARELLGPARSLLEDTGFWQNMLDGLAVLACPGTFRTLRVPLSFPEFVIHGEGFYVRPFLPLLSGDGRFHILGISQKNVRLFEASRDKIAELDLENVPKSLTEALGDKLEGHSLQFHTEAPRVRGGKRAAVFHGHGAGEDDRKDDILKFMQRVDDGLAAVLEDRSAPMVLASVDYLIPLYREVSKHPNLFSEGVEGNPDGLSVQELHGRAWEVISPLFLEPQRKDLKRYEELAGTDKATADLETIVTAGFDGRIGVLFLADRGPRWGVFDPASRRVEAHEKREKGDVDLLDLAVRQTLSQGGRTYELSEERAPLGGPLAAILRY